MNSTWVWVIIIGIIVVLLIAIFFVLRWTKKLKQAKVSAIPQDVLNNFERAEWEMKHARGEADPYEIMYRLSKTQSNKDFERGYEQHGETSKNSYPRFEQPAPSEQRTGRPDAAIIRGAVDRGVEGGQDIQAKDASIPRQDSNRPRKPKHNSPAGDFFSRLKRGR